MANKTILQVLHTLNVGGAEILAAAIARQLQNEFCFEFVCLDELGEMGQALKSDGFKVHVLNRKPGFDRGCAQQLFDIYRSSGASLIHAHQYTPFFYAICAAVLKRRPPVLFTEHGRFHPDLPSKKRFVFNRLLLRKTDHVAAVGEAVKQALVQNEGIPGKRIEVIYNGIELSRFQLHDCASVRKSIRQSLGLNDDQFVATIVGRLDYLKDHVTAVQVAERVKQQRSDFRLLLVGDGPERPKIEEEIRKRQLEETVLLLGTRRDIPQLLAATDVCFLTSISEGIPLTLIEGMAASLPVVATNVGGVSEVVDVGKTGYLAPAKDVDAIAQQLIQLCHDPAQRMKMGTTGRERAERLFSEQLMHQKYSELFQKMG